MTEEDLKKALIEMWHREAYLIQALDADAEAEHAYKLAKATAYMGAEGTERTREAHSVEVTESLLLAHLKAKAVATYAKEKMKNIQAAVSARQSLLSASTKTNLTYTQKQMPG